MEIRPEYVLRVLLSIIVFLVFAALVGTFFKYSLGHSHIYGLVPLFDLDKETNIPTFYSSAALMLGAILLCLISYIEKGRGSAWRYWFGLMCIFVFLSLDEFIQIHERFGQPMREVFNTSGYLLFAWVIPYFIVGLVLLITYARFLFRLPRRITWLILLSGMIYISGAIGVEMISASISDKGLRDSLSYALITTIEEALEMFGIALFIYTLLIYIREHMVSVTIKFSE